MKFSIVAGAKRDWNREAIARAGDEYGGYYSTETGYGNALGVTAKTLDTAGTAAGTATEAWVGRRIFDTTGTATGTATESVVSG